MAPREAYPRAKSAAERALELDDSIAAAHMALAFAVLVLDWDWKTAEQAIDRALELDPSLPYARSWKALYMLAPRGRFHEAITEIRGARSDDPLSLPINAYVGMIDFFAGRYDDAREAARQALDLDAGLPLAHWVLGMAGEMSEPPCSRRLWYWSGSSCRDRVVNPAVSCPQPRHACILSSAPILRTPTYGNP